MSALSRSNVLTGRFRHGAPPTAALTELSALRAPRSRLRRWRICSLPTPPNPPLDSHPLPSEVPPHDNNLTPIRIH